MMTRIRKQGRLQVQVWPDAHDRFHIAVYADAATKALIEKRAKAAKKTVSLFMLEAAMEKLDK